VRLRSQIEQISVGEKIVAIIVRSRFNPNGIEFVTPEHLDLQVGYMSRPSGYEIQPHIHVPRTRMVETTQEVLFVRKGNVRVDFYNDEHRHVKSTQISSGDLILLTGGGHGFEMLDDTELIEVKQGPHLPDDKIRFNSPSNKE
jgi:mannose-6-phosphate isomerase-like protein (cupin superfamily)